ncbi:MAG: pilus assembly protein [Actinomycetota bacterium]|nr:pilus assembly protein [Actinomycetota bacterium]
MRLRNERGTAAVELALLAPVLLVLVAVVSAAGRMVGTKSAVLSVAREAARAGAEAPNAAAAHDAAIATAQQVAEGLGLDPARLSIVQDPHGFARGAPYEVSVSYQVSMADLPGLGLLPGSVTLGAEHAELIDTYRSRSP